MKVAVALDRAEMTRFEESACRMASTDRGLTALLYYVNYDTAGLVREVSTILRTACANLPGSGGVIEGEHHRRVFGFSGGGGDGGASFDEGHGIHTAHVSLQS